ncbi:MAG: TolB family protein, partial [Fimbriimonadaceae bacterium]
YRRDLQTGELETVLDKYGYLAEATISPRGDYMTFTGGFEGDLEIYRSDLDGENIVRLTDEYGYDGGPFVSWDGDHIVYRRSVPFSSREELYDFAGLLKEDLVRPGELELWIMDDDGSNKRQVTELGGANFAPFLHPNNEQIIFSSNFHDPSGREFDLFVINVDGTGLRQITFTPEFDGFPMFNRAGDKLLWASNRDGSERGETNIFVADWEG